MNARESAFHILALFEKTNQHLDSLIESQLTAGRLTAKERKFAHNLVSGVIRNKTLFDWKVTTLYKGNYKKMLDNFKIILRLALYELDFLDYIPPHATVNEYVNLAKTKIPSANVGAVNGILRTYLREGKSLKPEKKFKYADTQLAIKYSFPEWIIKRWLGFWGVDFVTALCESFNKRPVFDLRINLQKISTTEFKERLVNEKIQFSESVHFENVVKITDIQNLRNSQLLKAGFCSVQDESGLLATTLLPIPESGDRILDACSAPGGKYIALWEKFGKNTQIISVEKNGKRILKIRENSERIGALNPMIIQADAQHLPFNIKFEQILADVPCSGMGTIQKHPDIKWRRTLEEILRFQKLQLDILDNLSQYTKPTGTLVYCTCTIDPAENEAVIEQFLERNRDEFEIVSPPVEFGDICIDSKYIRTFPHLHQMDGSFAAILRRIN